MESVRVGVGGGAVCGVPTKYAGPPEFPEPYDAGGVHVPGERPHIPFYEEMAAGQMAQALAYRQEFRRYKFSKKNSVDADASRRILPPPCS